MKKIIFTFIAAIFIISSFGCANKGDPTSKEPAENPTEHANAPVKKDIPSSREEPLLQDKTATQIVDFKNHFDGLNGTAVFYNNEMNVLKVYNESESEVQHSPCSTFKIIITLLGLENGVLINEDSTMDYSGTHYPIDSWNKNLNLQEAFQASCVWYFRQVINKIDVNTVQKTVTDLGYGNCDISAWDGSELNPSLELNGFWLESSLEISPKEQVQVLAKIFDGEMSFSENSIAVLKNVMRLDHEENTPIYGKTGTGKSNAWFVGFFESKEQRWYFAVNLQDENHATGKKAREITLSIINSLRPL